RCREWPEISNVTSLYFPLSIRFLLCNLTQLNAETEQVTAGIVVITRQPHLHKSNLEKQAFRVLDAVLDMLEEGHRALAVDDAVVVTQGDVHHRTQCDLTRLVRVLDRAFDDVVHAQDAR